MNGLINGTMATCGFELKRSFTRQRIAVTTILILFPPMMISLLMFATRVVTTQGFQHAIGIVHALPFAIIFLVSIVCILSLLLWATPNVYSELEGKSWSFIASRPRGRVSVYLGKFLASVIVSFAISLISMSLCLMIANKLVTIPNVNKIWISLFGIYLLASIVYGSIFSMLGTIFYKRAMVVGAGFMIGSEVFLATVPAVIGKFSMRYHLQELGISWIGFFIPFAGNEEEYRLIYGEAWSDWLHVLLIIACSLLTLFIGVMTIVHRQYITADES